MPAYNEGRRIAATLAGLRRFQPNVIVVDDGSRDDTSLVALRQKVTVLRHIVNHTTYHRGQVASKLNRFGIQQAETDFVYWVFEQIPQTA